MSPMARERPCRAPACSRSVVGMSPHDTLPETSPPTAPEVTRALADRSVRRAVWRAVRDERLRASFDDLRADGLAVNAAVERLVGPHRDEHGRVYFLSDERVRALVYRKRDRRRAL